MHDAGHRCGEARRDHRRYRPRDSILRRGPGALLCGSRFLRPWSRTYFPRAAQHRALRPARTGRGAEAGNVFHGRADDQPRRLRRESPERRLDRGDARSLAFGAIRTQHWRHAGWFRDLHALAQRMALPALLLTAWCKRPPFTAVIVTV